MLHDFTLYLNREEDEEGRLAIFSRFGEDRYQAGDVLERVWSGPVIAEDHIEGLEFIFAMFNRGSGSFVGDDVYPHRSLSVGDVVEIDGERYSCEPVGWKQAIGAAY